MKVSLKKGMKLPPGILRAGKKISPLDKFWKKVQLHYPYVKDVSTTWVSMEYESALKKALIAHMQKRYPFLTKKKIISDVAWNMLQWGPASRDDLDYGYVYIKEL